MEKSQNSKSVTESPKGNENLLIYQPLKFALQFLSKFKLNNFRLVLWDFRFTFFKTPTLKIEQKGNANNPPNIRFLEELESFLGEFKDNLLNLHEKLKPNSFIAVLTNGSLKFHLKIVLDDVFGIDHFINEIFLDSPYILVHDSKGQIFERTDYILLYSTSDNLKLNPVYNEKISGGYWHSFVSKGQGTSKIFLRDGKEIVLSPPPGTHWKLKQETILRLCQDGLIQFNSKGNPEYWVPEKKGHIIDTNWLDIKSYDIKDETIQNSVQLYDRLFNLILNRGDLYLDLFSPHITPLLEASKRKHIWVGVCHSKTRLESKIAELKKARIPFRCNDDFQPLIKREDETKETLTKSLSERINEYENESNYKLIQNEIYFTSPIEEEGLNGAWMNKLILGDCMLALPLLKADYSNKIKLIYIDPPYFTGIDENLTIPLIPGGTHSVELPAYPNRITSPEPIKYFETWFKSRVKLMKELLAKDGHIFVRFDYHFGHYAKLILEETFGRENFIVELFVRRMKKNLSKKQEFRQNHLIVHADSILVYRKSDKASLNLKSLNKRRRKAQDFAEREFNNDNLWTDIAGYE